MNIPTANIIVAFDRETMDRLFSEGATYKSLISELAVGDTNALLFNNVANPNFISFEHAVGIDKMGMKLTFIDPKEEFEKRFFTTNPARLIQGFSNPSVEKTTSFVTNKPDDVKASQSEYDKNYVAQYKKELDKHIGERAVYVAYGTGNNLDLWSGPHRTVLTNADISVKGAKKITLTLVPISNALDIGTRRGAYNEKVNLNLQGLKIRHEGVSNPIVFTDEKAYDPAKYLSTSTNKYNVKGYLSEDSEVLEKAGFESLSAKLEKFDFHTMVVDALRNYIQQATSNKNVIVLLPNLNIVCRQAIADEAKKSNLITTIVGEGGGPALSMEPPKFGSYEKEYTKDNFDPLYDVLGKEEVFVRTTLNRFGLTLKRKKEDPPKPQPYGGKGHLEATEKSPTAKDAFKDHFENEVFYATIEKTDREVPDHMAVIRNIYNKILKLSAESYGMSTLAAMTETETRLLGYWANDSGGLGWTKYPTLAGYDDFDKNAPAVIVGDLALIKSYLYGSIDLLGKKDAIDKYKAGALTASTKQAKGELDASSANEGDYLMQGALQHPIHPMDKLLLLDTDYNKYVRRIVNPKIDNTVGAFGDISYLPDEFSYNDKAFSTKEEIFIKENNIPVFRYNTENPNVLDLKFKFGAIYFALLKTGYQKEISRLSSAVVEGVLPTGVGTFPIRTRGAAIAYLRSKGFSQGLEDEQKQALISDLATRISPDLAESLKSPDEAKADSLAAYLESQEKTNLKGLIQVDQELPGNPNNILANMSEDLFRKALQMSITTLPTFHLSRLATLNTQCLVFAQDQSIKQTRHYKKLVINKFFSGLYKIMGFKHVITTSAATSEFKLVKNAPNFEEATDG